MTVTLRRRKRASRAKRPPKPKTQVQRDYRRRKFFRHIEWVLNSRLMLLDAGKDLECFRQGIVSEILDQDCFQFAGKARNPSACPFQQGGRALAREFVVDPIYKFPVAQREERLRTVLRWVMQEARGAS